MAIDAVSLPFSEQSEFFRRKINLPTQSWTDVYREQHEWAFVVAGANRDNLVEDFRQAVQQAIDEGMTKEGFLKQFDSIVAKHGWSYNGGRSWRSRVIYDTNLRSSYMAGRYEQLMAVREQRPYWRYVHSDSVEHPRPLHESWNGLILRWDDPWWRTHFPINAWGCQCGVEALSERDLKRLGLKVSEAPPMQWEEKIIGKRSPNGPRSVRVPRGIDPGFEYTPGQSRLHGAVQPARTTPPIPGTSENINPNTRANDVLPRPRILPRNEVDSPETFLNEFGATPTQPTIYNDVMGERIVIGEEMFIGVQNFSAQQLKLISQALESPDEIWTFLEWFDEGQQATVRRRYIARFMVPGESQPVSVVFERGRDGWTARTSLNDAALVIDDLRVGVRLFERGQ